MTVYTVSCKSRLHNNLSNYINPFSVSLWPFKFSLISSDQTITTHNFDIRQLYIICKFGCRMELVMQNWWLCEYWMAAQWLLRVFQQWTSCLSCPSILNMHHRYDFHYNLPCMCDWVFMNGSVLLGVYVKWHYTLSLTFIHRCAHTHTRTRTHTLAAWENSVIKFCFDRDWNDGQLVKIVT